MNWKRGSIAGVLSLLLPGLGQLYNRQAIKVIPCTLFFPCAVILERKIGLFLTFRGTLGAFAFGLAIELIIILDAARVGFLTDKKLPLKKLRGWASIVAVVLLVANIALQVSGIYPDRLVGLRAWLISSRSMAPALMVGDRVVANIYSYRKAPPHRGDVIVFRGPQSNVYVKRVVAIGGDSIAGTSEGIMLNGALLNESYVFRGNQQEQDPSIDIFGPLRVPAGTVFVIGDNRENSYDSRSFGGVPVRSVLGRAEFVYWSKDHSRIGLAVK